MIRAYCDFCGDEMEVPEPLTVPADPAGRVTYEICVPCLFHLHQAIEHKDLRKRTEAA